ncbi:MAG TPA: M64 family metallopeptidase [Holophagaceae bacterium]|nr:M64 family metallopeptidase [Holophagaceae bacterium]
MRLSLAALFACALSAALSAGAPRTLRLDYVHSGDAKGESFALARVVEEPLPWPGNPDRALDDSNLGKYRAEVRDVAGKVIYSRGFASIFGEWQDTAEAGRLQRAFEESVRFPEPAEPVTVHLLRRRSDMGWKEVWSCPVDPKAQDVERAAPPQAGALVPILKHGDPAHKVDFLILGDGYTAAERPKFLRDARRLAATFFRYEPYKSRKADFNVWALCPASPESGISRPSTGIHRRSALGCTYDAFGAERYILTFDNRAFRDAASQAPYDFVEILVNGRTYGGGGIHQLYGTVASDNAFSEYVFIHEFGHHIAGLADEYYTSDAVLQPNQARPEPWEPNVTADPLHPKWADLLTPGIALPTPWKKAEFEAYSDGIQAERHAIRAAHQPESVMEDLFRKELAHETELLGTDAHSGQVGAFEGANYERAGYYRSQEDCIMFTRDLSAGFCAACRKAISTVIDQYSRP